MKLATELSKRATGKTLVLLDEPTTGLHIDDVARLIKVLQRLTKSGNTVLVIEHNLDVLKTADYIIDLGPDGGDRGGEVIATGTPEDIAESSQSYTGEYLRKAGISMRCACPFCGILCPRRKTRRAVCARTALCVRRLHIQGHAA